MKLTDRRGAILLALMLIIGVLGVVFASGAIAHTPSGGATCSGYFVKADNYESRDTNTIESKFDGVETKRNFATHDAIGPNAWPQDGVAHTWSGYVHTSNSNPAYSHVYGPITLTCGTQIKKDAAFDVTTTPATCEGQGSASVTTLENAVLVGQLDQSVGTHNATANAITNHRFPDNSSSKTVSYNIQPKDVSQHCFVQPPDEHQYKHHSTVPNCKHQVVVTTNKQRDRSYVWDGTKYVPGPWSAWYVTSVTKQKVDLSQKCARYAHTRVHVTDKCNCFMDKVLFYHGKNVWVHKSHPNRLTWVFLVTGKKVNGHQYLLPSKIGGSHGWAATQTYKVKTTNVPCPCHITHTCPVNGPPHHHCRSAQACKLN